MQKQIFLQVRCKSACERMKMCDRYTEGEIPEYFFDRYCLERNTKIQIQIHRGQDPIIFLRLHPLGIGHICECKRNFSLLVKHV